MKVKDIMTHQVIRIQAEETVDVAARTLARYNIGALPVCDHSGKLCGVVTDRDLVTRCVAAGKSAEKTKVADVMTGQVTAASPDMETGVAAHLMGRLQVRRLPVVEKGKLMGIVSLGDIAVREETSLDAGDALSDISSNLSVR